MMPLPRLLYALSQDGLLPGFFAKVHSRTNVPVISTVISGFMVGMCDHLFHFIFFLSGMKLFCLNSKILSSRKQKQMANQDVVY